MNRSQRWTMVAVVVGSGVVFLDSSVVNLALPRMAEELPSTLVAPLEAQSYVTGGYFVTLSALLILAGALTDRHGRKRVFALGLAGFAATSLLCGLAPTMELLIAFRVLQGAAGAFVVPGSLSIITANFHGEEQGRAFGLWAGASALTTLLGPFVGGVLVNSVSWRAAFLLNLPLLALAYVATVRHVAESRDERATGRLDWLGSVLVVAAVGGLAFGTIRGQQAGWGTPAALVALAVGAVATVLVPIRMLRAADPLVPPWLFRSRNFTVTNLSTFVIYGALYVGFTFLGLFLIGTLGYDEPAAGIALLPGDVFLALLSARFGRLAARHGPRVFMAVGPALMATGLLLLLRVPATSDPWMLGGGGSILPPADYLVDLLPGLALFGFGLAVMVAPLTTALMTSVPEANAGVASAVNNAISRVGSPLVTAVIFVVVVSGFYGAIAERVPEADVGSAEFRRQVAPLNPPSPDADPRVAAAAQEASTDAFHLAMLVSAGLLAAGAAINGLGIRNPRPAEAPPELRPSMAPARGCVTCETPVGATQEASGPARPTRD
jgi:EmrB/QacA subfamily drug resistance transporter